MFIRKKSYQKLVNSLFDAADLILKQQRLIEKLNDENRRLQSNVLIADIDFPNTSIKKGGIEDSNIFR